MVEGGRKLLVEARFGVEVADRPVGSLVVGAARVRVLLEACRLDSGLLEDCQCSAMHCWKVDYIPNAARIEEISGCAIIARVCEETSVLFAMSRGVDDVKESCGW